MILEMEQVSAGSRFKYLSTGVCEIVSPIEARDQIELSLLD